MIVRKIIYADGVGISSSDVRIPSGTPFVERPFRLSRVLAKGTPIAIAGERLNNASIFGGLPEAIYREGGPIILSLSLLGVKADES